ncbi:MAG: hypothetical protein AAGA81_02770 [Acidobacteriota bacterium]
MTEPQSLLAPFPVMEHLCVVGSHWTSAGTEGLAALTIPESERPEKLRALKAAVGANELLYVATCNRVEVILAVAGDEEPDEEDLIAAVTRYVAPSGTDLDADALEARFGDFAVQHLFSVASGLDAARAGETEIRSQLRRALAQAAEMGLCGERLQQLVEHSLLAARRIHETSGLRAECTSLAHVAVDLLGDDEPVALLGVTPIIATCAARLLRAGRKTWLINRTVSRAQQMLEDLGPEFSSSEHVSVLSLEEFKAAPPSIVALITAVGADEPVLERSHLQGLLDVGEGKLRVLDLGVPENVSRADCEALSIEHLGMDEINEAARAAAQAQSQRLDVARRALRKEVNEYRRVLASKSLAPVMIDLGAQARDTLRAGVHEIVSCRLIESGVSQCGLVDSWIERMAKKVSHVPFVGLRALAATHGPEAVASFLEAADPELAERYARAIGNRPVDPKANRNTALRT